jgi:hypothetical protein
MFTELFLCPDIHSQKYWPQHILNSPSTPF